MVRILTLVSVLLFSFQVTASEQERAGQKAAEDFLKLYFFYKGRGMMSPPGFPPMSLERTGGWIVTNLLAQKLNDKFGLIVHEGRVVGFNEIEYKGQKLGAIGCVMCHSGKAAGIFIPGLGNKNIDVFQLHTSALEYKPFWDSLEDAREALFGVDPIRRELRENAWYFIKKVGEFPNLTQGLVSIGNVRQWFFEQAGVPNDSPLPGQVKVPALWGYGEKRKVGSFADGAGYGVEPGWAILVELVAGQKWQHVLEYESKIHAAEDTLGLLLPPKYPFPIHQERALRGQVLFQVRCAGCHGTYEKDENGLPIYQPPKHFPWVAIRTDRERLDGVTELFRDVVAANPLGKLIQATELRDGYLAPRLEGIWARFPYLHNASIPTLYDLLMPAWERPKFFSLRRAGETERFDKIKVGLRMDPNYTARELEQLAESGARWVYDTRRLGHSNEGHDWRNVNGNLTSRERLDLVEYLKTL